MAFIHYIDRGVGRHFELPEGRMVVFGREDHCDFQIVDDSRVSREHFALERLPDGRYQIIDLGATNGTTLNGRKLTNEVALLCEGDEIQAGRERFTFLFQKKKRVQTADIVNSINDTLDKGKGYKTVLREIVGDLQAKK